MTRLVVVSAGLSVPSSARLLADRLAAAAVEALGEVEVELVELRQLAHQITDHLLTGFASGELAGAIEAVGRADGLIVVTPVFSASYSGLFKSFFDVLEAEILDGKPVLVAASEDFGDTHEGALAARIDRAAGELAALMGKVDPTARRQRTVADGFADPVPFEQLLHQATGTVDQT